MSRLSFLTLACFSFGLNLWAAEPVGRPAWSIAGQVGFGAGGLKTDAAVVLPVFGKGPTTRLDFTLHLNKRVAGSLYFFMQPSLALSLANVTVFRADYWTTAVQVPWGLEFRINETHAFILGAISNFEVAGTLKVNHPVSGTPHYISLAYPDLYRGFLAGGSIGWMFRTGGGDGVSLAMQVYQSTFNSVYIGGRLAVHIEFYASREKDAN